MLLSTEFGRRGREFGAVTNGRGEFQIKNVSAGKYFVMVDAAGVITPISLLNFEQLNSETIEMDEIKKQFEEISVDGVSDKEVQIKARRGGAIGGRITYEDGDPAINVRVGVMRRKNGQASRFLTGISPAALFGIQTDDRGMYRIAGLPPGEYIVSAAENIEHGDARQTVGDDFFSQGLFGGNSLAVVYYQNATSLRSATPVKIEAGEEEKNIDITLPERALHTIAGVVRSRRDGRPLRGARISIENKEEALPAPIMSELQVVGTTDETGQFTINEVPDGSYTITVQPSFEDAGPETIAATAVTVTGEEQQRQAQMIADQTRRAPQMRRRFFKKQQDVKIAGRDMLNLVVEMTEGGRISGTVVAEGGKSLAGPVMLYTEKIGESQEATSQSGIDPQGRFIIDGVPTGKIYLNVHVPDRKFYVKTMTAGGTDLTREPLNVQESAEIRGVQVVLSSDVATLSGHVLSSAGGEGVGGANVLLVPADASQWNRAGARFAQVTETDGSFTVACPPGDYLVMLILPGEAVRALGEEFVRARAATAQRVSLQPNEQKSIELIAPRK
jgi:hypothetical protein